MLSKSRIQPRPRLSLRRCTVQDFTMRSIRPNKRTLAALNKLQPLISLYHLTPTFFPLAPAALSAPINAVLAPSPSVAFNSRPRPSTLYDIHTAHRLVDEQKSRFDAAGPGVLGGNSVDLDLPTNFHTNSYLLPPSTAEPTSSYPLLAFTDGSEPPLRRRFRLISDALHGTTNGGLAGEVTLRENLEKATQLEEGLKEVERSEQRARREEEEEMKGWEGAWGEDDKSSEMRT